MRRLLIPILLLLATGCEDQASPSRIPDGSTTITKSMRGIWNAPGGTKCRWWIQSKGGAISNRGNTRQKAPARTQSQTVVIGTGNVGEKFKSDNCGGWSK
jgi:hypothetical protein